MLRWIIRAFICLCLWGSLASLRVSASITIGVAGGGWAPEITSGHLQTGPGSDLLSTYTSAVDAVELNVSGATGIDDYWRIDVHRTDTLWHPNLTLSLRRTGDGLGGGGIADGLAFQPLDVMETTLCSGNGDRTAVPMQLRLGGVSLQVPPATYITTITYTVVDQ